MNLKSIKLSRLVAVAAVSLIAAAAQAQQPGSGGTAPTATPTATPVPIDGGASLLLASGAAYALKRLRRRQARR